MTEICEEDIIVRLSSPQIISPETATLAVAAGAAGAAGSAATARAGAGGAELGRRLLLAARAGDTAAVLDLMAKGAPFTTDWLGTSPLHLAAANDHAETCAVLLRAGVSRDSRTKVERTPLHLAAHAGHARVVALLLDHGAMVDCRDMLRMTPLHWAAARGHVAAARELLRRGADPRARCKFRKTPRCLAARRHRDDLLALLDSVPEPVAQETPKIDQGFETVSRLQEIKTQVKDRMPTGKTIIIESKTEPVPISMSSCTPVTSSTLGAGGTLGSSGTPGAGGTQGEALLRAHGITLLPADRGCTVLTALRSGRTVVLSDAGKLMLKESTNVTTSEPQIIVNSSISNVTADTSASETSVMDVSALSAGESVGGAGAARMVRPARNVKVVTINKQQPFKRIINPSDLQQVKLVQMPTLTGGTRSRPGLKLLLNKVNLQRLLGSTTQKRTVAQAQTVLTELPKLSPTEAVAMETETTEARDEAASLRAQLQAARAALAHTAAELRAARAKLALYEDAHAH